MLEYFIKPQTHRALFSSIYSSQMALHDTGGRLRGSGTSKQNDCELRTGCRMTKITMGITRLWENLRRDERFIELY